VRFLYVLGTRQAPVMAMRTVIRYRDVLVVEIASDPLIEHRFCSMPGVMEVEERTDQ